MKVELHINCDNNSFYLWALVNFRKLSWFRRFNQYVFQLLWKI